MRYAPVNSCIYCDSSSADVQLSDEHIIPFGLNGDLILPKASCVECAKITGAEIEQYVLRKMLIELRTHKQLKTRKPKDRPKLLRIGRFGIEGEFSNWEDIAVENHPLAATLPEFGLPADMTSNPFRDTFELLGANVFFDPDFRDKFKRLGKGAGSVQLFRPDYFCRMIAKIGHSYAVAELGYKSFEMFLPDIILGKSKMTPRFVGNTIPFGTPSQNLHHLWIDRSRGFIDVYLRLFAKWGGGPTYWVIAGR